MMTYVRHALFVVPILFLGSFTVAFAEEEITQDDLTASVVEAVLELTGVPPLVCTISYDATSPETATSFVIPDPAIRDALGDDELVPLAFDQNEELLVLVDQSGLSLFSLDYRILGQVPFAATKAAVDLADDLVLVWNERHQVMVVDVSVPGEPVIVASQFDDTVLGDDEGATVWPLGDRWVTQFEGTWYLWDIVVTEGGEYIPTKELLTEALGTEGEFFVADDVVFSLEVENDTRVLRAFNTDLVEEVQEPVPETFSFETVSNLTLTCPIEEVTPISSCVSLESVLRRGSEGEEVRRAQMMLDALGYHAGAPDGRFGIRTWLSVIDFQKEVSVTPSGVIDEVTRIALNEAFHATDCADIFGGETSEEAPVVALQCRSVVDNLHFRDEGSSVVELQEMLTRMGYGLGQVDGRFGTKTIRAIIAFQRDQGLTLSARTDTETQARLNELYKNRFCEGDLERDATTVSGSSASTGALLGSCAIDLLQGTHEQCVGRAGISFIQRPRRTESVLQISLDPRAGEARKVRITAEFGKKLRGWLLNVGDSGTNNGWGGDARTQERNSELHIRGGLLSIYVDELGKNKEGQEHALAHEQLPLDKLVEGKMEMTIANGFVSYTFFDRWGDEVYTKTHTHEHIFALDGQADAGGVNHDIYIGLNRTVHTPGRDGKGITNVVVELLDAYDEVAVRELVLSER